MKIKTIKLFLLALVFGAMAISCTAGGGDDGGSTDTICDQMAALNAHPFTAVTFGDDIQLSADHLDGVDYYWYGPGGFESYSETAFVTGNAGIANRGTYYCTISHEGCTDRVVSVDVVVNFPQGTPSCALTNNTAQFSGSVSLASQAFGFMTWGSAAVGDNYEIVANGTNGDMYMYMSPYWKTHGLEDGVYHTTSDNSPDYAAYDEIYLSDVNGSILWHALPNQTIYVSHVGTKRRISFCSLNFTGSMGGPTYTTIITAQLTQP